MTVMTWKRDGKQETGAVAVEFALVLPILILLVFGAVEFGLALYNKEVITNASHEGARAGIRIGDPRPSATQITNVVKNYLTNAGWDATKATITVTGAQGASGSNLTVNITYPYSFQVLPNFIKNFSKTISLSAQTVMQQE